MLLMSCLLSDKRTTLRSKPSLDETAEGNLAGFLVRDGTFIVLAMNQGIR